jgi:uncharacterized protein (TIGR03546 family)
MLTLFVKFFKALNSEQSPAQLAAAVSLAAIIGLTPMLSLHNVLVLLVVFLFRVNLTIFFLMWPLFSIFGLMIEPLAQSLGLQILQATSMQSTWQDFYNTLIGRWSNFYYSGVIGSLVIAVIFAVIMYPISKFLISQYRQKWVQKFEQYKVVKILKATKFWQLYNTAS